jgi:hypothetical protein
LRLIDASGLSAQPAGAWTADQYLRLLQNTGSVAGALLPGIPTGYSLTSLADGSFKITPTATELPWLDNLQSISSLVEYVQDTANNFTDPNLTTNQKLTNQASNSVSLGVNAAAGSNVYTAAFLAGWNTGSFAYQNIPGVKSVSDAAVTNVGQSVLGQQGFTQWSSMPSWIDSVNNPGAAVGSAVNGVANRLGNVLYSWGWY